MSSPALRAKANGSHYNVWCRYCIEHHLDILRKDEAQLPDFDGLHSLTGLGVAERATRLRHIGASPPFPKPCISRQPWQAVNGRR